MTEIKRILCAVDFSDCSRHALDEAIAIGHVYDASVTVLHVFPQAIPSDPFAGLPEFQPFRLTDHHRAHLFHHLQTFAQREGAEARRIDYVVREGVDIDAEILVAARQIHPDLIVIGTHGRSGVQHLMLGSVAEKVLHKACCPVLTVPQKAPDSVPARPFTRILCGIDFSECSIAALRYAIAIASRSGAHIDALSVVQLIPMYEVTAAVPLYYPGLLDELKTDVGRHLQTVVTTSADGVDVECLVTAGTPHAEIVRIAKERQSELVVVGAHSHPAVERIMFGSTTNHVVRRASCPVLTIRK